VMIYASWLDFKTREVEPRLWLYASTPLAVVSALEAPYVLSARGAGYVAAGLAGSLLALGLVGALYYVGMMGGGDLFASAMMIAAHPWPPMLRSLMPFLLDILVYSAAAFLIAVPAVMLYNLALHRGELRRIRSLKLRLVAAATAIPMKIKRYVESDAWLFPLEDYRSGEPRFRSSFDIDEDPGEHKRILRSLMERGAVSGEQVIWVTYGVPFLIPMTAGYIAGLMAGDRLLIMLLQALRII